MHAHGNWGHAANGLQNPNDIYAFLGLIVGVVLIVYAKKFSRGIRGIEAFLKVLGIAVTAICLTVGINVID